MIVRCEICDAENAFAQSNRYHAGFANQGYLYNGSGSCTLVWSSFDPVYEQLAGPAHPWTLDSKAWQRVEEALGPSPDGTDWSALNPPRCGACSAAIGRSISEGEIYYLVYPGSVLLDESPAARNLALAFKPPSPAT